MHVCHVFEDTPAQLIISLFSYCAVSCIINHFSLFYNISIYLYECDQYSTEGSFSTFEVEQMILFFESTLDLFRVLLSAPALSRNSHTFSREDEEWDLYYRNAQLFLE